MLIPFSGGELGLKSKKKNVYVFGNEHLEFDSFARKVAGMLSSKINTIDAHSPDILLDSKEKELLILDVVKNIKKPMVISDISKIKTNPMTSLHDFDVGFFLKLMNGMGINKKIKIIGIPQKGNISKISKEVEAWI